MTVKRLKKDWISKFHHQPIFVQRRTKAELKYLQWRGEIKRINHVSYILQIKQEQNIVIESTTSITEEQYKIEIKQEEEIKIENDTAMEYEFFRTEIKQEEI